MTDFIRLTYASKLVPLRKGVRNELITILSQSQQFNHKHGISGVLFYNNNYFFQCLEGERSQLMRLYNKIANDSRHIEVVQLACERIDTPAFGRWKMKYVLEDQRIRHFFLHHHGQVFNPYLLTDSLHDEFVQLLRDSPEIDIADLEVDSILDDLEKTKPFYASRLFGHLVIIPLTIISLLFYLFY